MLNHSVCVFPHVFRASFCKSIKIYSNITMTYCRACSDKADSQCNPTQQKGPLHLHPSVPGQAGGRSFESSLHQPEISFSVLTGSSQLTPPAMLINNVLSNFERREETVQCSWLLELRFLNFLRFH